jgi:hypothetical protein
LIEVFLTARVGADYSRFAAANSTIQYANMGRVQAWLVRHL